METRKKQGGSRAEAHQALHVNILYLSWRETRQERSGSHPVLSLCPALHVFLKGQKGRDELQVILGGQSHYNFFPIAFAASSDAHTGPPAQVNSQFG